MNRLLFLLPFVFILTNCSSPYKAEIQQLDVLSLRLDSARLVMNKLDTGLLFSRIRESEKKLAHINTLSDTLTKEDIYLIDSYVSYSRSYGKLTRQVYTLYEDVEVLPMQVENLITDLSNNAISKEKCVQYMQNETEMAEIVINKVGQINAALTRSSDPYIEIEEKIILLIQRLESENSIES